MEAKIEQKRSSSRPLLGILSDLQLPMHKLQLAVTPTAPALAVVALVLLLHATARRPCSFLDAYRSGVVVSLPSPSGRPSRPRSAAGAAVRVPSGCDIFRPGEWVPDEEALYYDNLTCPLIQEHQNCMKYGRPDRGFLCWRWRPDGCDLPRFDAAAFFDAVRNSSLAFVGDSLGMGWGGDAPAGRRAGRRRGTACVRDGRGKLVWDPQMGGG